MTSNSKTLKLFHSFSRSRNQPFQVNDNEKMNCSYDLQTDPSLTHLAEMDVTELCYYLIITK